jgi:hypothetical protein
MVGAVAAEETVKAAFVGEAIGAFGGRDERLDDNDDNGDADDQTKTASFSSLTPSHTHTHTQPILLTS